MTSAFLSFINRKDYDESSFSSSQSLLSSSQKKNYFEYANEYIALMIKKWNLYNLQDTNLWATFRDDIERWTEQDFKTTSIDALRELPNFVREHDVWISRQERKTIAKSLQKVLENETETSWTKKKIMNLLNKTFQSDRITHLLKTDFERNSKNYFWQISSRSKSRRASSSSQYSLRFREKSRSRESSFRDWSERSLQQSSMRHLFRESFIARTFLRQSSSSSSQSEVQETSLSKISETSENFYSDSSSHQSETFHIRQSEKKSILRQLFLFRLSKFYQSSELSEQFYRQSTEYSSFVSSRSFVPSSSFVLSRSLSHEYSSSVLSRSFVLSSSSVNQSIRTSDYDRELINLTKLYSDEIKYSEKNDNISFKLIMFNDMCDRIDVFSEIKLKTLSIMLKELALDYY
jgi:hypothetical protein